VTGARRNRVLRRTASASESSPSSPPPPPPHGGGGGATSQMASRRFCFFRVRGEAAARRRRLGVDGGIRGEARAEVTRVLGVSLAQTSPCRFLVRVRPVDWRVGGELISVSATDIREKQVVSIVGAKKIECFELFFLQEMF
jgi:hypothetical protein